MITRSLEQIVLARKRTCCRCGKTMVCGETVIRYTVENKGAVTYHSAKYWCMDCEKPKNQEAQG